MDNLMIERDQKKADLAAKEADLSRFEQELASIQDKDYQVRFIEDALAAQYAEFRKIHPIDSSQEPEIAKTIQAKNADVNTALKAFDSKVSDARAKLNKYSPHYFTSTVPSYWDTWKYKTYAQWERAKEREKKQQEKLRHDSEKAKQKNFDDTCKAAKKICIDELKRLFGELEIDIKRFYKSGISKENLNKLVSIMDRIYVEGSKIGTIPLSYQQKVYKWQQTVKDLPDDEEKQNQAKEDAKKQTLVSKQASIKSEISEIKKEVRSLQSKQGRDERKLAELKSELEISENKYQYSKEAIKNNGERKKREAQEACDANIRDLRAECESTKEDLQANIRFLQREIETSQSSHEQLLKEKSEIEEELDKTFVLSFSKKKLLREKISEIEASIANLVNQIQAQQEKLGDEMGLNPEQDFETAIGEQQQELAHTIAEIDRETAELLTKLDVALTESRKAVIVTEDSINSTKRELSRHSDTLKKKNEELSQLNESIDSFHADYMISTYGKSSGLQSLISEKKSEIKTAAAEIKVLNKEIAALDKEAAKIEKELARERDEQHKAQLKKAQEEERIRLEQQERQERIQKELLEREQEQSVINEKANSLADIKATVQEIEASQSHELLQESNCPLSDDGKRVITNSIVRKQYTQSSEIPDCVRYALLFVDKAGEPISEQRLIEQKGIGEKTTTSFELKASSGFNTGNYYLLIINFETGKIICAQKYKINISFSNDFDF